MILTLDGDLDPIAPGRRGRDGVGALGRNSPRRDVQREKLSGQIVEGDLGAAGRPEAEGLDVVGHILLLGEHERAEPSELSRRWVVLEITRRLALQERWLGQQLDLLVARPGGREALAEFQQKARVSLNTNFSAQKCQRR